LLDRSVNARALIHAEYRRKNLLTYRSTSRALATASRQLDFVFASETIADRVRLRARKEVAD
jgi:hypothetical protein